MKQHKTTAPLRKIIEVLRPATDAFGTQRVKLECGHEASASSGAIYRARCLKCRHTRTDSTADGKDSRTTETGE
jgi:hypothetical protein